MTRGVATIAAACAMFALACTRSARAGLDVPYAVQAVADTITHGRLDLELHDRVAAAVGLPPLRAASLPSGWREIRVSDASRDGMVREERVLRVVWSPSGPRVQILQWWPVELDSSRDANRPPNVPESRFGHGCHASVIDAGRIRACVLWTASPTAAAAVAALADSAAWGRPPWTRQQRTQPPTLPQRIVTDTGDSIIVVRTDTIRLMPHAPRVALERRNGAVYRFDHYSDYATYSSLGPSPDVAGWLALLDEVTKIRQRDR